MNAFGNSRNTRLSVQLQDLKAQVSSRIECSYPKMCVYRTQTMVTRVANQTKNITVECNVPSTIQTSLSRSYRVIYKRVHAQASTGRSNRPCRAQYPQAPARPSPSALHGRQTRMSSALQRRARSCSLNRSRPSPARGSEAAR